MFRVEIPDLNPLHPSYVEFWRAEAKKCIEGCWASGVWMPGKLYSYINYFKIKRNVNNSLVKYLLLPELRDIEWEVHRIWAEARGFSGFSLDDTYTCNWIVPTYLSNNLPVDNYIRTNFPEVLNSEGEFKTFITPREYLRRTWPTSMGSPIFKNQNKNLIMLGSRGYGKDLDEDTIVYTVNGPKKIKDVKVGNFVANHLGQFVPVIAKYKFEDQLQHRVVFRDSREVLAGPGHLWYVYLEPRFVSGPKYPKIMTTKEIMESQYNYKIYVPTAKPMRYWYKNFFKYDAYKFGYLISRFKHPVSVFRPYRFSNQIDRLMRGIIDGNGGSLEFTGNDRFLSYIASCAFFAGKSVNRDGNRLQIIDTDFIQIDHVEPTIVKPSYCISVASKDNLFVVNDLITTHNSYLVSGIVTHEFLFDGRTSYETDSQFTPSSESLIMAADAKYSSETLEKVKVMLHSLPGETQVGDVLYPPPFYRKYTGSFAPGKDVIQKYRKKVGGTWKVVGSRSSIKHRTFKDNEFAASGTRPGTIIIEEFGIFKNGEKALGTLTECQRDGANKFGSTFMIGTGGDMEQGAFDAKKVFYSPEAYDCLSFDDEWEFNGKIGLFFPAYLGLNQFKNSDGTTNVEEARAYLLRHREKLSKQKNGMVMLHKEMINRPIKPSEMFLQNKGSIFPIPELSRALEELKDIDEGLRVTLFFDPKSTVYNGVNYAVDTRNALKPINEFPYTDTDREGCVVIYELPQLINNAVPADTYIIGYDPVATDSTDGYSLSSVHVLKTKRHAATIGHDEIVATYFGRPYAGRNVVNDIVLKLALMYNAVVYFENSVGNVKEYFEKHKKLHLLAYRPQTVLAKKAAFDHAPTKEYGYPMSSRAFKLEGIAYLRDWLLEFRDERDGRIYTNLDRIKCRFTLQQLIAFNMEDNFDAVMSLMGAIIGINERYNQFEKTVEEAESEDVFMRELNKIIVNNPKLFKKTIYEV